MLDDGFRLIRSDHTQPGRKPLAKIPPKRRAVGTAGVETAHFDDAADCENDEPLPLWVLKITQPALRQLLDFLLAREPEAAGLLLGPTNDESLVTHFAPDLKVMVRPPVLNLARRS